MNPTSSIIISGAHGQLGQEFQRFFKTQKFQNVIFLDRKALDLSDERNIEKMFLAHQPKYWINCAAYTHVDLSEDYKEDALRINGESLIFLSKTCSTHDTTLVHFSTDYVFDGKKNAPYEEEDKTAPINTYGASKLDGEKNIEKWAMKHYIIRTSWVYSEFGKNFVKSMIDLGRERSEIAVVSDQIASPTYTKDLVETTIQMLDYRDRKGDVLAWGIYHVTNNGECSWNEFAKEIFRIKNISCTVQAISTESFGAKAARPKYTKLNTNKIQSVLSIELRHWREALEDCLHKFDKK